MKEIKFLGDSFERIYEFPADVQENISYQLRRLQNGIQPADFKPMSIIGSGVFEIRIRDKTGAYRVFYVTKIRDCIYILHAFKKKTQATPK